MKRNDILKKLMLQKNLCTADLARMTGIPYTTLKSIFDRGVEKSGYGFGVRDLLRPGHHNGPAGASGPGGRRTGGAWGP